MVDQPGAASEEAKQTRRWTAMPRTVRRTFSRSLFFISDYSVNADGLDNSQSPEAMKRKARPIPSEEATNPDVKRAEPSARECTAVHDQADCRVATQRFALAGERRSEAEMGESKGFGAKP